VRYLSKKEFKEILKKYPLFDWLKPKGEIYEKENIIYYNGKPVFVKADENFYPTLELIYEYYEKREKLPFPYVVVDKGATKFILKGADVMRPGIVELEEFKKGELVIVIDEGGNLLALGKALYDSEETKRMEKGKVIKNLKIFV